jgi:hypothetical protein
MVTRAEWEQEEEGRAGRSSSQARRSDDGADMARVTLAVSTSL